ncbi:hypothetical protein [Cupriavidus plantarum]|uniref:hypothetical protein n=1 Tax=Cupriavidus plantarum TaxID=942865 RepID=UPI00339D5098
MANDFLVFGGAAGANVINQSTYAALTARSAGFSSGIAQSGQLNKVWRQSSIMSAVLAQFIADRTGLDVLDDGTTATILANLKASAAAVNGDATKTFSVATATAAAHAARYDQVLGLGQTQQSVTASRAIGTTYTNSTGKPIFVEVQLQLSAGQGMNFQKNGANVQAFGNGGTGAGGFTAASIVPPGYTYGVTATPGATLIGWYELRT